MPHGKIALVCGGRTYDDQEFLYRELDRLHGEHTFGCIVQGGARGADRLAKLWAISRRIPELQVEAHWTTMGQGAGTIRNQWMIDWCRPDLVIAFPGSTGTRDMVRRANNARIEVVRCLTR